MAWEFEPHNETVKAAGDLSTKQFYFVKLDSSGDVEVCDGVTDVPWGVLQNKPAAAGRAAEVMRYGTGKVSVDAGALSIGDFIGTSGDGQADAKTPGADTTEYIVGVVREDGAAGDTVTADIDCLAPHRAA